MFDDIFVVNNTRKVGLPKPEDVGLDRAVFEASEDSRVVQFADQQLRSAAMALVLEWINSGDFTYANLESMITAESDTDEDGTITDDETEYNDMLYDAVADAMITLGADEDSVIAFLDDEDDELGAKIGNLLSDDIEETEFDDSQLITDYALGIADDIDGAVMEDAGFASAIFESNYGPYWRDKKTGRFVKKPAKGRDTKNVHSTPRSANIPVRSPAGRKLDNIHREKVYAASEKRRAKKLSKKGKKKAKITESADTGIFEKNIAGHFVIDPETHRRKWVKAHNIDSQTLRKMSRAGKRNKLKFLRSANRSSAKLRRRKTMKRYGY